jgi:hypothetical protein
MDRDLAVEEPCRSQREARRHRVEALAQLGQLGGQERESLVRPPSTELLVEVTIDVL